jgi:hypothetical protein
MPPPQQHFRPIPLYEGARARGCYTCAHFHGRFFCEHVVCEQRARVQLIAQPKLGCAYWMREPGADDE